MESFGYEWTKFDSVTSEDAHYWAEYFRDVPLAGLGGRIGVDVGCGKGRFSSLTAHYLRALVALDGSEAVRAAVKNLADLDNVVIARADLLSPPLASGAFGFVCCLGVLHHLTTPRLGFERLVDMMAPGGLMLLYMYSRAEHPFSLRALALRAASVVRVVVRPLPLAAIGLLSAPLAVALYVGVVLPGSLGARLRLRWLSRLPLATYRGRPVRSLWLDTFDRLSAPIEHRFSWSELEEWFAETGLEVLSVREQAGFVVVAQKGGR